MPSRYGKRHYNDIAQIIEDQHRGAAEMTGEEMRLAIAVQFAVLLKTDNPLFDGSRFYDKCKGPVCYLPKKEGNPK